MRWRQFNRGVEGRAGRVRIVESNRRGGNRSIGSRRYRSGPASGIAASKMGLHEHRGAKTIDTRDWRFL